MAFNDPFRAVTLKGSSIWGRYDGAEVGAGGSVAEKDEALGDRVRRGRIPVFAKIEGTDHNGDEVPGIDGEPGDLNNIGRVPLDPGKRDNLHLSIVGGDASLCRSSLQDVVASVVAVDANPRTGAEMSTIPARGRLSPIWGVWARDRPGSRDDLEFISVFQIIVHGAGPMAALAIVLFSPT